MSLLDGGQKKDLPTMSWESVLEGDRAEPPPPVADAAPPAGGSADPSPGIGEIKLEIPSLDDAPTSSPPASRPTSAPAPAPAVLAPSVAQPIVAPAPLSLPGNDPGAPEPAVSFTIPDIQEATPAPTPDAAGLGALVVDEGALPPHEPTPTIDAAPQAGTPSSLADLAAPAPAAEPAPPPPPPALSTEPPPPPATPTSLHTPPAPPTPSPSIAPSAVPPPAPPLAALDVASPAAAAHAVGQTAPVETPVPQVDQPSAAVAPTVPQVAVHPPQPPPGYATGPYDAPAPSTRPPGRRSGVRRFMWLLFTLVVVGGLVAAALVFGKPYLFPDEWDSVAKPYAQEVERALGAEFVEPVTVNPEEAAPFEARRSAQLFGDWESELPVWRSLGLANGQIDQPAIDRAFTDWVPAMYSQAEGQVYYDANLTGAELDAQLTLAMAQVALDQNLQWSTGQSTRSLDDAALTEAHVLQQSSVVQQGSQFDATIPQSDIAPLVYLPPVLGYRVVAPVMFVELLPSLAAGGDNPLARPVGPGPLDAAVPAPSNLPALVEGETVLREGVAHDRSFWYLVFASYVDAPQAYAASQSIVENSVTVTDRGGRACVVSTFSGGDIAATATLGATLEAWSLAAPAEFGSSTSALPDGTLQFSSCDPGVGFENGARFGVARELIGFRLGEIATVVDDGATTPAEIEAAVARYEESGAGPGLAALPFDTSPADAAQAARAAANAGLPTLPPVVPPGD